MQTKQFVWGSVTSEVVGKTIIQIVSSNKLEQILRYNANMLTLDDN